MIVYMITGTDVNGDTYLCGIYSSETLAKAAVAWELKRTHPNLSFDVQPVEAEVEE